MASGGVGCCLHGVLDATQPRIIEAMTATLLMLFNEPSHRPSCTQLHTLIAPLTDPQYRHNYEVEMPKRLLSSCYFVIATAPAGVALLF